MPRQFIIGEKHEKQIDEWKAAIKLIYGTEGEFTYYFTPLDRMPWMKLEVHSHVANKNLILLEDENN